MQLSQDGSIERLPISSAIGLRQLRCSLDARYFFTINSMGKIIAWDRQTPKPVASVVPCDLDCGHLLPLSGAYTVVASQSENEGMLLPTARQSQITLRFGDPGSTVLMARDASLAGVADGTATIKLYPLDGSEPRELRGNDLTFQRIALRDDGGGVAAIARAEDKHLLIVFDAASGEELARSELSDDPKRIKYSHDGQRVAVEFEGGNCAVFAASDATMLESTPAMPNRQAFDFAGDGSGLIVADGDSNVALQPLLALGQKQVDSNPIVGLKFVSDTSPGLICCSRDGSISLWDHKDLSESVVELQGPEAPVIACHVSRDQHWLCVLYEDKENTICLWELKKITSESATGTFVADPKQVRQPKCCVHFGFGIHVDRFQRGDHHGVSR